MPQVSVYTFGAPRAGNHSFARVYERVVPDTWHVINDQVLQPAVAYVVALLSCVATQTTHQPWQQAVQL